MERMFRNMIAAVFAAVLAGPAWAGSVQTVFYIDMENHNLVQPSSVTSPQQLMGNPAAPYLNSLMTPGNPNAAQTSWASNYQNVGVGVHPSLPNYLWQEQGTNNGVFNDNQPFGTGGANQGNAQSLSNLLQTHGVSWKSYQEDIDLNYSTGAVLPTSQWGIPVTNQAGTFTSGVNPYNGSNQYNFATKHDGQLYFNSTNGNDPSNTSSTYVKGPNYAATATHYAPLQQFQSDLATNTVARYNLITPDQFNDMHTALTNGFTYNGVHYTGDQAAIAQGDSFLSQIVPQIMSSQAYQNNGAIVLWFDETEKGDSSAFTVPEIVISPLARGNAYDSTLLYTHSSDLKTLQNLFGVAGNGYLGDAATPGTNDLSDMFVKGAVSPTPEPSTMCLAGLGAACLAGWRVRKRQSRLAQS